MLQGMTTGTSQIPFSFGPTYTPAEPPRPCDAVYVKGKRAIVTHVDDSRDNPRGDVVLCVTWCDSGRDGVVFWAEVDGGTFRH